MNQIQPKFRKNIQINFGGHIFSHKVPILCPNSKKKENIHHIIKNGKDTSTKDLHQQYLCKDCGRSFYAHTSKYYRDLQKNIPQHLSSLFAKGRLSVKQISDHFNIPEYTASLIMKYWMHQVCENYGNYTPFDCKLRKSHTMIVDETFLTIDGKTWFLIIAITESSEVLGFMLTENRSNKKVYKFLQKCASRLEGGLRVLISDGFVVYNNFARKYYKDLIHVRHIHKPPYGNAEINIYHYDHGVMYRFNLKVKNNIFTRGRVFKAEVKLKKDHLYYFQFRPKVDVHNYSREAIKAELWDWTHTRRVRQKNRYFKISKMASPGHFSVSLRKGRVKVSEQFLELVAARLEILLPLFGRKHITSNLIENMNSVIKKCITFGVKRNIKMWREYLTVFFAIRDNPKVLAGIVKDIRIPVHTLKKMMPSLITIR